MAFGKPLRDIPNRAGFRFRGVLKGGNETIDCVVMLAEGRTHYAARESDGGRVFDQLEGWHEHIDRSLLAPRYRR